MRTGASGHVAFCPEPMVVGVAGTSEVRDKLTSPFFASRPTMLNQFDHMTRLIDTAADERTAPFRTTLTHIDDSDEKRRDRVSGLGPSRPRAPRSELQKSIWSGAFAKRFAAPVQQL